MTSSWTEREFPDSAVVVAPTAEAGAVLAVAFDNVAMITLDNLDALPSALASCGCAVLTGVPTRGGRLATVMSALRSRGPMDLQVMVDLRGPAITDLRRDGAPAMVGFAPVDRVDLYGISCLRLVPDADPDALPDLHDVLAVDVAAAAPDAGALRVALDRAERAEARLRELAAQTAALQLPAPGGDVADLAPTDSGNRPVGMATAGLLAAGGAAALACTSRDRRGALLTTSVGALSLVQLWYAQRTKRRLMHAITHPGQVTEGASEELLAKILAQQTDIHRNLAIVTAAVQDTAAAVAALAGQQPSNVEAR